MLTEDYCSYEVAKLLKEKGFDEPTTFVWYQHLPESLDCRNLVNKKARDYFYHDETTERNSSYKNSIQKPKYIYGDIFSCPTHQMAMKWRREKQGIIITVDYNEDEDCENNERFGFTIYQKDTRNVGLTTYPTYENAVEAALKYCLTNLI